MMQSEMTETEVKELLWLARMYRREAMRCKAGKSYVAACVMIGAALETDLLLVCELFSDEIPPAILPKRRGSPKHVTKWTLHELLCVARECNWLPSGLNLKEAWDSRRAIAGDYAVVLRQVRNLVHPAYWIKYFGNSRMTNRRMEMCFDWLQAANDWLMAKVEESIKSGLEEEE